MTSPLPQAGKADGTVGKALEVLDQIASFERPVKFSELLDASPELAVPHDVAGARALGMTTVLLGRTAGAEGPAPDHVISRLGELPAIVEP